MVWGSPADSLKGGQSMLNLSAVYNSGRRAITMRLGNDLILDRRDLTLDAGFIHALLL
jgi:hypothetical protein